MLTCLIETGDLYTWGSNEEGQLGHNDTNDKLTPQLVAGVQNEHVYQVYLSAQIQAKSPKKLSLPGENFDSVQ